MEEESPFFSAHLCIPGSLRKSSQWLEPDNRDYNGNAVVIIVGWMPPQGKQLKTEK